MITFCDSPFLADCEEMDRAVQRYLWQGERTPTQSSVGVEPIRRPADAQSTRHATNPNWSYRGDNVKYRSKK